jgi:hypothetical protein
VNGLRADLRVAMDNDLSDFSNGERLFATVGLGNRQRLASPTNPRAVRGHV